ncbi:hypothetical protein RMCBS344292_11532 [Rhizopus microsporus]|nr:hypothetical protein RMCBS344292_11532 [Rhizopus microsporus]
MPDFDKSLPAIPNTNTLTELDKLLTPPAIQNETDNNNSSEDEVDSIFDNFDDELLDITLGKDMDLREYANKIIEEKVTAQEELERNYLENVQSFIDLHTEIQYCDQVLGRMEGLLNAFQSDLGTFDKDHPIVILTFIRHWKHD